MVRLLTTTALLGLAAVPAIAQDIAYFGAEISSNTYTSDGTDEELSGLDLNGELEYTINEFYVGASLSSGQFDLSFGPEFQTQSYALSAGYMPMSGVLVGASVGRLELSQGAVEQTIDMFDVFAQYDTGQYAGAILYTELDTDFQDYAITQFFGRAEVTSGVTLGLIYENAKSEFGPTESTNKTYHISADYASGPVFARGYVVGLDSAFSFDDEDTTIFGLRGAYDIGSGFSAVAQYEFSDTFQGSEYNSYAIGGSYVLLDGLSVDASFGRLDVEGSETDFLALGLTYDMGSQIRIDKGMLKDARDDTEFGPLGIFPSFGPSLAPLGFGAI